MPPLRLLGLRLVPVVVPTLDLAAQTALAWRADGHHEHMVIVSSMDTHGHEQLYANRVGSTSNAAALAAAMSVVGPGKDQLPALTVISTYDSLDKIEAACQHTGLAVPPFELAIMDFTNCHLGVCDVRVEWSAGAGEGCGLMAGGRRHGGGPRSGGAAHGGWPTGGGRLTSAGDRP
ncbi:hypothetical protein [Streptomyces sp. NPDC006289]|uniref:hypothetical protein n=1 Tax=Streptomyces sp. NPDC006289 TaxID=3156744 RepID=UPI0033A23D74